ncbi:1-phosphatidylinositol phosphodiesterase [Geosmithia morbida]|uniref:1-phosphatidylinositol phosphodiesterase n=1 Tax=Geosmithia morbida TaxID=1094350 RepID=A0A9P4YUW9_9HYPO|nr:1-phosphatidylinositol phosphodiesterase [Geosmithia morbida]KAF4122982.1 1-phosphatidylinositol phosphodiesterase [Geosmithia morbida]
MLSWRNPIPRLRMLRRPPPTSVAAGASVILFFCIVSYTSPYYTESHPDEPWSRPSYHGHSSAFSFDAGWAYEAWPPDRPYLDPQHRESWMARIPDSTPLTDVNIPGTHDTMTYAFEDADEVLQCQTSNVSTQLAAGVRYLDIRARLQDDSLRIYHADGPTGFDLTDVLMPVFDFLDRNPSEVVVMRLKEEGPPVGDGSTMSFEQTFNHYRLTYPVTADGADRHLALHDGSGPVPTLGELRSKIFLIQNFASDPALPGYGLLWEGDQMVLEDVWVVEHPEQLMTLKWPAIRDALEVAAAAPDDDSRLYLTHVSASVGVLPIEAAAGPILVPDPADRVEGGEPEDRVDRREPEDGVVPVVGMNDMTGRWLQNYMRRRYVSSFHPPPRVGVVIFDFPGRRLVDAVLDMNAPLAVQ